MCQRIDDVVHAQLERLVRQTDRHPTRVSPLPGVTDVVVVVRHRQEPPVRVVVLEQPVEDRDTVLQDTCMLKSILHLFP